MKKIRFRQTIAIGLLMAFSVSSVTPGGAAVSSSRADTLRALNVSEADNSGLEESLKRPDFLASAEPSVRPASLPGAQTNPPQRRRWPLVVASLLAVSFLFPSLIGPEKKDQNPKVQPPPPITQRVARKLRVPPPIPDRPLPPIPEIDKEDAPLRDLQAGILEILARFSEPGGVLRQQERDRTEKLFDKGAVGKNQELFANFNTLRDRVFVRQAAAIRILEEYITGDEKTRNNLWDDYKAAIDAWFDAQQDELEARVDLTSYLLDQARSLHAKGVIGEQDLIKKEVAHDSARLMVREFSLYRRFFVNLRKIGVALPFPKTQLPAAGGNFVPQLVPPIPNGEPSLSVLEKQEILLESYDLIQELLTLYQDRLRQGQKIRIDHLRRIVALREKKVATQIELDRAHFLNQQAALMEIQIRRLEDQRQFVEAYKILVTTEGLDQLPLKYLNHPLVRRATGEIALELGYAKSAGEALEFDPSIILSVIGDLNPIRTLIFLNAQQDLTTAVLKEADGLVETLQLPEGAGSRMGLVAYTGAVLRSSLVANRRLPNTITIREILTQQHQYDQAKLQQEAGQLVRQQILLRIKLGLPVGDVESTLSPEGRRTLEFSSNGVLQPGSLKDFDETDDLTPEIGQDNRARLLEIGQLVRTAFGTRDRLTPLQIRQSSDELLDAEQRLMAVRIRSLARQKELNSVLTAQVREGVKTGALNKRELADAEAWEEQSRVGDAESARLLVDLLSRKQLSREQLAQLLDVAPSKLAGRIPAGAKEVIERLNGPDWFAPAAVIGPENLDEYPLWRAEHNRLVNDERQILRDAQASRTTELSKRLDQEKALVKTRTSTLQSEEAAQHDLTQGGMQLNLLGRSREMDEWLRDHGIDLPSPIDPRPAGLPTIDDLRNGLRGRNLPLQPEAPFYVAIPGQADSKALSAGFYAPDAVVFLSGPPKTSPDHIRAPVFGVDDWNVLKEFFTGASITDSNANGEPRLRLGRVTVNQVNPSTDFDRGNGRAVIHLDGYELVRRPAQFAPGLLSSLAEAWNPQLVPEEKVEDRKMVVGYYVRVVEIGDDGVERKRVVGVLPAEMSWTQGGRLSEKMSLPNQNPNSFPNYLKEVAPRHYGWITPIDSLLSDPATGEPLVFRKEGNEFVYLRVRLYQRDLADGTIEDELGFDEEPVVVPEEEEENLQLPVPVAPPVNPAPQQPNAAAPVLPLPEPAVREVKLLLTQLPSGDFAVHTYAGTYRMDGLSIGQAPSNAFDEWLANHSSDGALLAKEPLNLLPIELSSNEQIFIESGLMAEADRVALSRQLAMSGITNVNIHWVGSNQDEVSAVSDTVLALRQTGTPVVMMVSPAYQGALERMFGIGGIHKELRPTIGIVSGLANTRVVLMALLTNMAFLSRLTVFDGVSSGLEENATASVFQFMA